MKCKHDAESQHRACDNGYCPLCLQALVDKQWGIIKEWERLADKWKFKKGKTPKPIKHICNENIIKQQEEG
jgi:hypothetical protein